jgi:hypothetical protein
VRIRTVLDARAAASPRFARQTLLLAHSWAAQGHKPPLEVIVLGRAPAPVHARLRELGVEVTTSPPHRLEPLSGYSNKLLGLQAPSGTAVMLVDNDVCFLDDVSDLRGRNVRASVAGAQQVKDAQWAHIAATTGYRPLELDWIPLREQLKARADGRVPRTNRDLFLNSGVVWIRRPAVFEPIWAAHIAAISRAFADSPLSSRWVRSTDQPGFATAVAEHGGFDLLPTSYNYRPVCFQLGLSEQPIILHLLRLGAKDQLPFPKTITSFWDENIIQPIRRSNASMEGRRPPDAEQDRLLDEAVRVRDRVLRLVAEAGSDTFELRA